MEFPHNLFKFRMNPKIKLMEDIRTKELSLFKRETNFKIDLFKGYHLTKWYVKKYKRKDHFRIGVKTEKLAKFFIKISPLHQSWLIIEGGESSLSYSLLVTLLKRI